MSRFAIRIIAAVSAALAGCTLLTPLDGFSGSAPAGGETSALAEGAGVPVDGRGDAGVSEANAPQSSPACTSDVRTDPKNCGRCGRDCGGGSCSAGMCAAVVVASALSVPKGLAVDADSVYWGAGNAVQSCSRTTGCSAGPRQLATINPTPDGLAVANGRLFFAAVDTIYTCPVTGCGAAPTIFASRPAAKDVVVDATKVYFNEATTTGRIVSCPLAGCGSGPFTIVLGQAYPVGFALSDTKVFFPTGVSAGGIYACSLGGCGNTPVAIAQGQSFPGAVAVGGGNVYWLQSTDAGFVSMCPVTGCSGAPIVVAGGQYYPTAIAADDTDVYWTTRGKNNSGGTLQRCPARGCGPDGPEVLIGGLLMPTHLVLAATTVYALDRGVDFTSGRVLRVSK